ncbi:MAG: hypothetical protein ACRYFU_12545 [Janthinobacterium lividum]
MRRFVGLLFFVLVAFPVGLSVAGCSHSTAVQYCNTNGAGPVQGQVATIVLASNLTATGESLNFGQIGTALSASAEDCVGHAVTVSKYVYETSNPTIADINPNSGAVCGGTWNRNSGGGVGDYTVCTAPATTTAGTASITATGNGAVSNAIQVYVHAPVTGVALGVSAATTNSCSTDPSSDCCPYNTTGSSATATAYDTNSCLSQTKTGQLVARVYANGATNPANNITCQVGPLSYALEGATNVASIDVNGIATANQPGSALVTATVANSSSALSAGFISTCPPVSITLSAVNYAGKSSIPVAINTPQSFTTTVLDKNGYTLTGLALEFNSTQPVNIPTSSSTVTAAYPGSATITAVCQQPSCNSAPFSQIGYQGNGKPVTSNGITVTAPGTASTVLYMGSTASQYLESEDFTTAVLNAPVKLPYIPNSMVISQDGTGIYMGSTGGMLTFATASGAVTGLYQAIQGNVLAVAPNNTYVVVTDPTRSTISLVTPAGAVFSSFNGTGTHAQWTPDSTTLYVTTSTNQLLTYSTFVGWESTTIDETQYNDVAVTVPYYGAYFAGPNATEGRSYCASTTQNTTTTPPTTTNVFTPLADQVAVVTDRLTATTDGNHILAATAQNPATLDDIVPTPPLQTVSGTTTIAACPLPPNLVNVGYFAATPTGHPLTGISATTITGVVAASNSNVAFVTYTGTSGQLPLYAPATGVLSNVTLSGGTTTAPVAGVFSTDNTTFYAGTSGDNVVHVITVTGTTGADSGVIAPKLTDVNGNVATPNLIVQRPRRTTS